jgi:hypothetical protein
MAKVVAQPGLRYGLQFFINTHVLTIGAPKLWSEVAEIIFAEV